MSLDKPRQFYEVQRVLKTKLIKQERYYLIKWKGYTQNQSTWQPEAHVAHLTEDIDDLNAKRRRKQKHKSQELKCKKILKEKKKTNVQKIKQYLNSKSKEVYRKSNQPLNIVDLQKNSSIGKSLERERLQTIYDWKNIDSQACILDKIQDFKNATIFKIYKNKTVFQMSQKQTKLMFPFQLSLFYQRKIRKVLFPQGNS